MRGVHEVRRPTYMDVMNFTDIVSLISIVCHCNIAQFIIGLQLLCNLLPYPPYLSKQAVNAFGLFPKLMKFLTGHKSNDDKDGKRWLEEQSSAMSTILLQQNLSYREMLDQVHFGCNRVC